MVPVMTAHGHARSRCRHRGHVPGTMRYVIRTDTACGLESAGGRPTSTAKPRRCAADISVSAVLAADRFLRVALTSTGGCATGAKLFVGLEMVIMTIWDTPPAMGAA